MKIKELNKFQQEILSVMSSDKDYTYWNVAVLILKKEGATQMRLRADRGLYNQRVKDNTPLLVRDGYIGYVTARPGDKTDTRIKKI